MKKGWIFVIVVLIIAAGTYFYFQQKAKREEEQKQKELEEQRALEQIEENVSASGEIKATEEVELKFQTSGKLAWIGVKEGDRVEKWQAIAKLDTYELEKKLKDALLSYSKERNDFDEEYFETYREQTPYSAINDTVKRILEKNQWDLDKAVVDVEIKNNAVRLATLTTPISGIITKIDKPIAGINIVYTADTIVVSDPDSVEFVAEVDEVDIPKIREGQKAIINLDAYEDEPIETVVKRISFASKTTSGGGTVYEVFLKLPENENLRYRLGMNGDVEFEK